MAQLVESLAAGFASAPSGNVYFYLPGTTVAATVYQDADGTVAFPAGAIALGANGEKTVYTMTSVRMRVETSAGVLVVDANYGDDTRAAATKHNNAGWTDQDVDNNLSKIFQSMGGTDAKYLPVSTATQRTVKARLSERLSVMDFGARGDGSTDDLAAFNALNAALASRGGGEGFVPATVSGYVLSSTLSLSGGVSLIGEGNAESIMKLSSDAVNFLSLTSDSVIDGLTLGRTSGTSTSAAIYLNPNASNCVIQHNGISGFATPVRLQASVVSGEPLGIGSTRILHNAMTLPALATATSGIYMDTDNTAEIDDVFILGNTIRGGDIANMGIYIGRMTGRVYAIANTFFGSFDSGIYLRQTGGSTLLYGHIFALNNFKDATTFDSGAIDLTGVGTTTDVLEFGNVMGAYTITPGPLAPGATGWSNVDVSSISTGSARPFGTFHARTKTVAAGASSQTPDLQFGNVFDYLRDDNTAGTTTINPPGTVGGEIFIHLRIGASGGANAVFALAATWVDNTPAFGGAPWGAPNMAGVVHGVYNVATSKWVVLSKVAGTDVS